MQIIKKLIGWYTDNKRDLPWRNTRDPYHIWLSEIVLQQTKVAQGQGYYERLLVNFPTVEHLANAPEELVMKLWQGLGYYSRARNLHAAAKQIQTEFNGSFPTNYVDIRKLKGVGDYTAAAIASFAFGLPHAVVDGNVYRVLSRLFGISTPIDSATGKKEFAKLAQELLSVSQPDTYNQAIMEFGALQCVPKSPACSTCVFCDNCYAYQHQKVAELPYKAKKTKQRSRYFTYIVPHENAHVWVKQRKESKDIWQNLFEFPLVETKNKLSDTEREKEILNLLGSNFSIEYVSQEYKHVLSHQILWTHFAVVKVKEKHSIKLSAYKKVDAEEFSTLALPRLVDKFVSEKLGAIFSVL